MQFTITILLLLGLISIALATNHVPPSFDFQQFYGSATGLPSSGQFKVRAVINNIQYETPIASNGQYGYSSPTFKVYQQDGLSQITFYVVNQQTNAAVQVGTATYLNRAVTRLDFSYTAAPLGTPTPPASSEPAICGNNFRESPEACDGTDLASQTCASQAGAGSTGTLNCTATCTFNASLCVAPAPQNVCWQCNDWGQCINNRETRSCSRSEPCSVEISERLTSEPAEERLCLSANATAAVPTATSCQYNWECGGWSLCRDGQQTRYCYRLDQCEQYEDTNVTIIPLAKPEEQRACQTTEAATPAVAAQVCSTGMKRCFGQQLQLCSADGKEWVNFQSCPHGCDSLTQECKSASTQPQPARKAFPVWIYYLIGSLVLVGIIVVAAVSLMDRKKYAPAKEYVAEARERGMNNSQIEEKLIEQGWNAGKIEKLLK